jgi:hypothetical protein
MAPRCLVDAERPLRDVMIQDQYRYWLTFTIRGYQYKRWFASEFARNTYRQHQIPGGVVIDSGEAERVTTRL